MKNFQTWMKKEEKMNGMLKTKMMNLKELKPYTNI